VQPAELPVVVPDYADEGSLGTLGITQKTRCVRLPGARENVAQVHGTTIENDVIHVRDFTLVCVEISSTYGPTDTVKVLKETLPELFVPRIVRG
jgi:hypothetical protein